MEYKFDVEKHRHWLMIDGKWRQLTGCTTVLGVIAKPKLIQWAADMVVGEFGWIKDKEWNDETEEFVRIPKEKRLKSVEQIFDLLLKLDLRGFLQFLDKARIAHVKKKENAGDWGTQLHSKIEILIREAIDTNKGIIVEREISAKPVFNFVEWAKNNKVKFLESEKNVYSESLFIGGIVDIICMIDGEIWLGDIKTSKSGIYAEHFWQMAGYHLMLEEMGLYPNIKGYLVLNIKENGTMVEKRSISNEDNRDAFLAVLKIYRIQEKINKAIKS